MAVFKRSEENPVLIPLAENEWEMEGAFNGCPVASQGKIHLLYRAVSSPHLVSGTMLNLSTIGHAVSDDGIHFKNRHQFIKPQYDWDRFGCEDPRVTRVGNRFYIFYTALSAYPFSSSGIRVGLAVTRDFQTIESRHPVTTFNAKAMAMFPQKIGGRFAAVLTANTDNPPSRICLALFDDEEQIWSPEYWEGWYAFLDDHMIPLQRTSFDHIEVGAPPLKTPYGWLLVYSYIQNYFKPPATFGIEAVLLDLEDPQKIVARLNHPLLYPEAVYEMYGKVPNIVFPSGALIRGQTLRVYYGAADTCCAFASGRLAPLLDEMRHGRAARTKLERFSGNPILKPVPEHGWESKAVFNPAAAIEDGKVHLLYRAMSPNDISVMGYASSEDGFNIDYRDDEPAYAPRRDFESKGCEDPRLTRIDDTYYMCYTAWDGHIPRIALSTIPVNDLVERRWNWTDPVLISPPGVDDKDAAVFPRKFNGKYAVLHRIGKSIWLDLVDNLDFGDGKWLKGNIIMSYRRERPHAEKIGIASQPLETKDGWLLLYHIVGRREGKVYYYASAALLDLEKPWRVIGRRKTPLLEPEMSYEKEGQVPNVVFPCGAVIKDDRLFVYYGGGDSVIGVAVMELEDLLESLRIETTSQAEKPAVSARKKTSRTKIARGWTECEGFIPGVPFMLPEELAASTGATITPLHSFKKIADRNTAEFSGFIEKTFGLSTGAGPEAVAEQIEDLMLRTEKEIGDSLLTGNIATTDGTRQIADTITAAMSRNDVFALTDDSASQLLHRFPPYNLLIKYNRASVSELEKQFDPSIILALAGISEENEYMDRIWDWIWDNGKPEHFGFSRLKPFVVASSDFPALTAMREASALSKLAGRIILCNLLPGTGGRFARLRYLTTVSKNIIEAERYGEIWDTYAGTRRNFGQRIVNSLEGHWGKEPLSTHNIFENRHQRIFVERLRDLAQNIGDAKPDLSAALGDIAASYHLYHTFPGGHFVPCSAWTWASYSFKGGKGIPTPLSLHVERDWASRDLMIDLYQDIGGSEEEMDELIARLMGEELESENMLHMLFPGVTM